jgi:hypothetical protein
VLKEDTPNTEIKPRLWVIGGASCQAAGILAASKLQSAVFYWTEGGCMTEIKRIAPDSLNAYIDAHTQLHAAVLNIEQAYAEIEAELTRMQQIVRSMDTHEIYNPGQLYREVYDSLRKLPASAIADIFDISTQRLLQHTAREDRKIYTKKDWPSPTTSLSALSETEYLNTAWWALCRARAMHRAALHCQTCGTKDDVQVYHNTRDHLGCELTHELVVLCATCHAKLRGKNADRTSRNTKKRRKPNRAGAKA